MKTLKMFISFTAIVSLIFMAGCKKDDNTNPDNKAPDYELKTVQVPDAMAQSSDAGAQEAVTYINMVNGMSAYGSMMTPPPKSAAVTNFKDGGGDVYVWEVNDGNTHCTFTLRVTETASMYSWEMTIDGTLEGQIFNDFVYMRAEEAKDGSSSSFTVYDPDTGGILVTLSWYESGGSYHFTYEVPEGVLLTIVVNPDGSGSVEMKSWENGQYLLGFRAEWDASGHGQWWEYEYGELIGQGSW